MTATEARFQCRHILADGRRCRSACLRHEEFCYYHHASRKPIANPVGRKSRRAIFTLPRIEDRASILTAINEILGRIGTNDIDARRAGRLLYALQIAACSMPRPAALKPVDEEADPGLIEEVVQHPTYGEIAPRSELALPERDQPRKSLAQELREEMEALEARNIAEFGACADADADSHSEAHHDVQESPLEPIHIQLNDMRAELLEAREDLAKAKARLAEAKADTQRAEEGMVWHMDRQFEARAELEALKSATQHQPATLPRLHAVANSGKSHKSVLLSEAQRSRRTCFSDRCPQIRHSERCSSRSLRRTKSKKLEAAHATHTAQSTQPRTRVPHPVQRSHRRLSLRLQPKGHRAKLDRSPSPTHLSPLARTQSGTSFCNFEAPFSVQLPPRHIRPEYWNRGLRSSATTQGGST